VLRQPGRLGGGGGGSGAEVGLANTLNHSFFWFDHVGGRRGGGKKHENSLTRSLDGMNTATPMYKDTDR
jgi:hypothetical protein